MSPHALPGESAISSPHCSPDVRSTTRLQSSFVLFRYGRYSTVMTFLMRVFSVRSVLLLIPSDLLPPWIFFWSSICRTWNTFGGFSLRIAYQVKRPSGGISAQSCESSASLTRTGLACIFCSCSDYDIFRLMCVSFLGLLRRFDYMRETGPHCGSVSFFDSHRAPT